MHELYIRLLCQFEPMHVYAYLSTRDDYPLDPCLRLCQEYNITDATAFLLERTGDVNGALDLIVSALGIELGKLEDLMSLSPGEVVEDDLDSSIKPIVTSIQDTTMVAIGLCKRHSGRVEQWYENSFATFLFPFIRCQLSMKGLLVHIYCVLFFACTLLYDFLPLPPNDEQASSRR